MVKLLFLPHCLREDISKSIIRKAEERNYEIYIANGGSMIKKVIKNYNLNEIEKIVGVACKDEIYLASNYFKKIKFNREKLFSVALFKEGCKNTLVDIEKLLNVL